MRFLKTILFGMGLFIINGCAPNSVRTSPDLPDDNLIAAQATLVSFFELVSSGHYQEALAYYAGPSEELLLILQEWHPDWQPPPNDPAAILEKICTGGFQCFPLRTVLISRQLSDTEFEFEVELSSFEGELFVFGPCCGASETEMPPQSIFTYKVVQTLDGRFLVEWGPLYIP